MDCDAIQIYCPNSSCQAPNAERSKFCQRCRTLLPKRYLWAIEPGKPSSVQMPEVLDDRYVLKYDRVYLDTQPGILPHVPDQVPPEIRAYLRLFPYRWNLPQIYGSAHYPDYSDDGNDSIWLLENAPIEPRDNGTWTQFPHIDLVWKQADHLHQLGWLWQILSLWTDCVREGVASTLLDPLHIRVDGSFIRIAQLIPDDTEQSPNLDKLGYLWSRWIPATKPPLHDFFEQLCQGMIEGRLHTPEQAQLVIDRAIDCLTKTRTYDWQVTTLSDRGPSRSRNEDACFPMTEQPAPPRSQVLGIVCDGVGGHDGGDIASGLAISTLSQRVKALDAESSATSRADKVEHVREAIAKANDAIGQRNNDEQRQGRQRMGTTIVIGQGDENDLFISHVGDSRAYLINSRTLYSLSVDDDVASREVRLGYAFYRNAVHQPAAGSLVQALGMGASSHLYPTTQRFILNDDCVVLLCSDGLSDYDRVEQHWKTEIQPILDRTTSLTSAAHRLVEIANTQNGHDNVTVALLQLRVKPNPSIKVDSEDLTACMTSFPQAAEEPDDLTTITTDLDTTVIPRRRSRLVPLLAVGLPIMLLAGIFLPKAFERFAGSREAAIEAASNRLASDLESDTAEIQLEDRTGMDAPNNTNTAATTPAVAQNLSVGQQVTVLSPVVMYQDKLDNAPVLDNAIPAGMIVEVKAIDKTVDRHWLQVRSCSQAGAIAADSPAEIASGAIENNNDAGNTATPEANETPESPDRSANPPIASDEIIGWVEFKDLNAAGVEPYEPPPGQAWSCDAVKP